MAFGIDLNACYGGSKGESILDWPFFSNQEDFDGGRSRKEETHLILFLRHRHIELLKIETILLCCLVRALES